MSKQSGLLPPHGIVVLCIAVVASGALAAAIPRGDGPQTQDTLEAQVLRGRQLVIEHACGDCHGGFANPAADGWLAGASDEPTFVYRGFTFWARNLTPDPETGLGRYSDRQVFNALRFGLRPGATPDVEITSATPGEGNHPAQPDYLGPDMPWAAMRHMTDRELLDIVAYLRHAVKPVRHEVTDSEAPPDRWAGEYTLERIGGLVVPPFPTAHEELRDAAMREQVLLGRTLVVSHGCGECHGGRGNPAAQGWLAGLGAQPAAVAGPYEIEFEIGPFKTRPRNLTPDNATGMGRFSERQIFNALRYGLRPGETADIEITSATPGEGNHPLRAKYLAPPMPWPAWRHMSDAELWAIAAYLKHGLKPVDHRVEDSEGPPDFWAGEYTVDKIGPHPAPPFPTANERRPRT